MNYSFAIITDGKSPERVQAIIQSIQMQHIIWPNEYEIIVVGGEKPTGERIVHIPFDETVKEGWITRKKNLAFQAAKYDNIFIGHDYISYDFGFVKSFEYMPNDWDVAMCRVLTKTGERFRDWVSWKYGVCPTQDPYTVQWVDYDDSTKTKDQYISGGWYAIKKAFALKFPLDENKTHSQSEDVVFCMSARHVWKYKMNKYASVKLLKDKDIWPPRHIDWGWRE